MKTRQLYWDDCYLKECDATVTGVDGNKVMLDQTIFCYSGGGQPADTGTLQGEKGTFRVVDVLKEDGELWHVLDREGIAVSDKVHGVLDWERRYALMRMHTATHVFAAVMHRDAAVLITGGQLGVERSRMDMSFEQLEREKVEEYVQAANEALHSGLPVKLYFLPREEALKIPGVVKLAQAAPPDAAELHICEIGEMDIQADGGTHVRNTTECGTLELLKIENKGKGRKRLYYTLR